MSDWFKDLSVHLVPSGVGKTRVDLFKKEMIHPTSSSIENSVVVFKRDRKRNNSDNDEFKDESFGFIEYFLIVLSFMLLVCLFPLSLILSLKVIYQISSSHSSF